MKNLRGRFERFCFRNRNKGIPNLMLYITLGTAIVYIMSMMTKSYTLYYWLMFDRSLILKGQVWRLFTYPLTMMRDNILMMFIGLMCYYSLGRAMENAWGTCKFNLFYLCGVVMMDIYCMIFGSYANVYYLNLSLFLAYATMYPNAQFLLFFVIPVKAWILALFNLVMTPTGLFAYPFGPANLFPLIALGNYFLFFGKDVINVIPISWQMNFRRLFKKKTPRLPGPRSSPSPLPVPTRPQSPRPRLHIPTVAPYAAVRTCPTRSWSSATAPGARAITATARSISATTAISPNKPKPAAKEMAAGFLFSFPGGCIGCSIHLNLRWYYGTYSQSNYPPWDAPFPSPFFPRKPRQTLLPLYPGGSSAFRNRGPVAGGGGGEYSERHGPKRWGNGHRDRPDSLP